jgi:hypothetical protein
MYAHNSTVFFMLRLPSINTRLIQYNKKTGKPQKNQNLLIFINRYKLYSTTLDNIPQTDRMGAPLYEKGSLRPSARAKTLAVVARRPGRRPCGRRG